jgi:hypothetical protein
MLPKAEPTSPFWTVAFVCGIRGGGSGGRCPPGSRQGRVRGRAPRSRDWGGGWVRGSCYEARIRGTESVKPLSHGNQKVRIHLAGPTSHRRHWSAENSGPGKVIDWKELGVQHSIAQAAGLLYDDVEYRERTIGVKPLRTSTLASTCKKRARAGAHWSPVRPGLVLVKAH